MQKTTLKFLFSIILVVLVGSGAVTGIIVSKNMNTTYNVSYAVESDLEAFNTVEVKKGDNYTITKTKPTKQNYEFKGWTTTKNSNEVAHIGGEILVIKNNVTLYPVWEEIEVYELINTLTGRNYPYGERNPLEEIANDFFLGGPLARVQVRELYVNKTLTEEQKKSAEQSWEVKEGIMAYAFDPEELTYEIFDVSTTIYI